MVRTCQKDPGTNLKEFPMPKSGTFEQKIKYKQISMNKLLNKRKKVERESSSLQFHLVNVAEW